MNRPAEQMPELYPWQQKVLDVLTERYPDDHPDPSHAGQFRIRRVFISKGRR